MLIKDVEKEVQLDRQTIFFYEKENLITPTRLENGYRDYSQQDIKKLQMIKFLRSLDISIDDVKGIMNGDIPLNSYLETHASGYEEELQEMQNVQDIRTRYLEKDLPPVPELSCIKTEENKSIFYNNDRQHVLMGDVLTQKKAVRNLIYYVIAALLLGFGAASFWIKNFPFIGKICFSLIIFILAAGLNHMSQAVEFHSSYILVLETGSFFKTLGYFFAALVNRQKTYMKRYDYTDIAKLTVKTKKRYFKAWYGPTPTEVYTADFIFQFTDGRNMYFAAPMFYAPEDQYIGHILTAGIEHIDDPDNILQAMCQGIRIDEYVNLSTKI